jgi:hypothetical protein
MNHEHFMLHQDYLLGTSEQFKIVGWLVGWLSMMAFYAPY